MKEAKNELKVSVSYDEQNNLCLLGSANICLKRQADKFRILNCVMDILQLDDIDFQDIDDILKFSFMMHAVKKENKTICKMDGSVSE